MLQLILPDEKYWNSFQKGLQEFKNAPTPYDTFAVKNSFDYHTFVDYKKSTENYRQGIGLDAGYAPFTRLWLVDNEKFVGIYDVRHFLTEKTANDGYIGYAIIPSARQKGYAYEGLKLCYQYAQDILGIKEIFVACLAENTASYKTMKKVMMELGGIETTKMINNQEEKRVYIRPKAHLIQSQSLSTPAYNQQKEHLK